jgi:tetratricopeptide (TPR) repeat protein
VAQLSRQLLANPPPAPPGMPGVSLVETAHYALLSALNILKERDALLREGEKFLASYPTSLMYQGVRSLLNGAIEYKQGVEEGKATLQSAIDELSEQERANPCRMGQLLKEHHALVEARRSYEACQKALPPGFPPYVPSLMLLTIALDEGDFAAARRHLAEAQKLDPKQARSLAGFEWQIPADL